MKTIFLSIFLACTICAFDVKVENKPIDIKQSNIQWKATKKVGDNHIGDIKFLSGHLKFEADKLVGGNFVVDMTSINTTDLEGKMKTKLDDHLKNEDFFSVEKHPESKLVIKNCKSKGKNNYDVNADITIKGKTQPITFDIKIDGNKAFAKISIDRTKHGIHYGSDSFFDNLGDKVINDDFTLDVKLIF